MLGPFKIKKVLPFDNYELWLPTKMKVHPIFHISLLKPTENKETKENVEAEEFEVEKILGKRTKIHEFEDSLDSEDMSGGLASLAEIKQTTCYKPTESRREKQGKEGPRNFEFANPTIETRHTSCCTETWA